MIVPLRTKPLIIEGVPWLGTNAKEIREFCLVGDTTVIVNEGLHLVNEEYNIQIETDNGLVKCSLGHWIIRDNLNRYSVCDPYQFEELYEYQDG